MLTLLFTAALLGVAAPQGDVRYPTRPGPRDFLLDEAKLLPDAVQTEIRTLCDQTLTQKKVPIVVVTIPSLADYGAGSWPIERYAMNLMAEWGIGWEDWNHGMLLLVSPGDRKARIELGAGWGRREDQLCSQIMSEHIIPMFKQGDYAGGIVAGVNALDKMARKLDLPTAPRPWWHAALVVGAIGLGIFTVISLFRRGASGWAWLFWAAIFGLVGTILYQMLTNRGSSSGGGFSGGSFGGGFSGGGGSTGSW